VRPCCDTKHASRFSTSASKPRSIRRHKQPGAARAREALLRRNEAMEGARQ
jgi:hypothetical protein